MLENYAFSGVPHKPISYIDQGTKHTCQCGYEWIENRFPEYDKLVCPRCAVAPEVGVVPVCRYHS